MSISRPNAQRVDVYNSGLVVFLYDEANREAINEINPDIIGGFRGSEYQDAGLIEAGQQRLLATYELQGDGELSVQVIVGPPLTEAELEPLVWFSPQRTRLNLPSGRFCIESYDSIQLGDEDPTDEPGLVEVPAGDYVLSLYRISHKGLEKKGIGSYEGPYEVIVLTPVADYSGEVSISPMLAFPVAEYLSMTEGA